jgi:polyisoprenoid-binding protein YceI
MKRSIRPLLSLALVALVLAPAAVARAADNYEIDPVHSVLVFRIGHMDVGVFYGRFNMPSGRFTFDEQNPSASSFQAQVKAADFDSGNEKRDQHVRGPDFLNAREFPTINFKSTSVKAGESGRYEVSGTLSLHGQTKPVTTTLQKIGSAGNRIGFEGTMDVKRSDFGIKGVQGVADEVRVIIAFEGVKK